jgi:hypothetical protein
MRPDEIQRGHVYVTESGKVRRADQIEGPPGRQTVSWRDPSGATGGRCDVETFGLRVVREATQDETSRAERARQ